MPPWRRELRAPCALSHTERDSLQGTGAVDVRGVLGSFAAYFVESGARGVHGGKNGWLFRLMVPRGFAYYRRIGARRMDIAGLDITLVDSKHALCTVSWHSEYRRRDGSDTSIDFDVSYVLRMGDGGPQIFAYMTGDERQALKDHGII